MTSVMACLHLLDYEVDSYFHLSSRVVYNNRSNWGLAFLYASLNVGLYDRDDIMPFVHDISKLSAS